MRLPSQSRTSAALASAALLATLVGNASLGHATVFTIDQTLGNPFAPASVVGTITTDGKVGVVSASDILSWNFQAAESGYSATFSSAFNEALPMTLTGNGLSETDSSLIFNSYNSKSIWSFVTSFVEQGLYYSGGIGVLSFNESGGPYETLSIKSNSSSSGFSQHIPGEVVFGTTATTPVPEPTSIALLAVGLLGIAVSAGRSFTRRRTWGVERLSRGGRVNVLH